MKRRYFLEAAAAALAASGAPAQYQPSPQRPKASLKLGTQNDSSDDALPVLAALGVNHICSTLPSARLDESWSAASLSRLRERVESFGIRKIDPHILRAVDGHDWHCVRGNVGKRRSGLGQIELFAHLAAK